MSVKYQITLPDHLALELKRTASRLKIPLAQLIRETMEQRLRSNTKPGTSAPHPLEAIVGLIDEEPDLASRVDEILYR